MSQHYNKFGKSRYILLVLTSDLKSSWYQKRDDWYILPSSKGKNYFSQFIWCRYIIKKLSFKLIVNNILYALKLQNIVIQKIKIDAPISKFQFWKNDLRNPDSLEKITLYIYTINNLVVVHWFKKFKKALYFPFLIRSWYISTYYDIACIEIMHRLGFKNW